MKAKPEFSSENMLDFKDNSSFTSDSSKEEHWDFKDTESMTDISRNNSEISDTMSTNWTMQDMQNQIITAVVTAVAQIMIDI